MGSKKKRFSSNKKRGLNPKRKALDGGQWAAPQIFLALPAAVEAPDGLKAPVLRSLYYLLVHFSSNPEYTAKYGVAGLYCDPNVAVNQLGVGATYEVIPRLSDVLFKELFMSFTELVSALQDAATCKARGDVSLLADMWTATEKINLLLRCCMLILNLFVCQQPLLLEKGKVLLDILRQLILLSLTGANERSTLSFQKSVFHECTYGQNDCTTSSTEDFVASLCFLEPSDPGLPFWSAMLEVFVDELSVNGPLRTYLMLIESVTSTKEIRFMCHSSDENLGIMTEIISCHFFLSFCDEQAFETFINRLFLLHEKKFRPPELSLIAATSMLLNPIMLSAPKYMLAHLVLLVSEATGICMGFENLKPELKFMGCYLSAFEKSIILYTKHMSSLQIDGHPTCARESSVKSSVPQTNFLPSFDCYAMSLTRQNIDNISTILDNSWHSNLRDIFCSTKSELVASSIAYIKANQFVLDVQCRDDSISILCCIVLRAADDANNIAFHAKDSSPQDVCLLAAILKLMSSSLLQVIRCLRHSEDLDFPKTLKNFSSCKAYDSIAAIIRCFSEFSISLPSQKSLCELMEAYILRHKESRIMLFHLWGLLSLSFVSGLDFLVKDCILVIMALVNLFVFEEGNLDALRSIMDSRLESSSSRLPLVYVQEAMVVPKSSIVVASKFQRIRTLYLRPSLASGSTGMEDGQAGTFTIASNPDGMEAVAGTQEETEETCNGEIFLKCMVEQQGKPSDLDDLADFIECRKGKNYFDWLGGRRMYRKWKAEKIAVLRWKKMKRNRKFMKLGERPENCSNAGKQKCRGLQTIVKNKDLE